MTETLRLGSYGNHIFLPKSMIGDLPQYDACVASLVHAETQGREFVLCADATDALNPASGWTGEFSDLLEGAPDPDAAFTMEPVIASAAARTSSVRFVWGPVDCVRRAPVNIAQAVLTLHHASRGRCDVILAHGQQNHMRQFGISRKGTADKLWDTVQIVRRMFHQSTPFSYRGRVWSFDNGMLALPHYGDTPPRLWIAGGGAETLELVGRFGDGWVDCVPGMDDDDPAEFARKIGVIRDHARRVGRDPDSIRVLALLCCIMSDDRDGLAELIDHPIVRWAALVGASAQTYAKWGLPFPYGGDYNYFRDVIPEWVSREEYLDVTSRIPREAVRRALYFGTADDVIARIEPWLACGVTDVVFYNPAALCGRRHMAGAMAAEGRLAQALAGRPVDRAGLA
ncbi:MAG: LLM class flavin-dependent oxidoreductase [Gammaproteobacteria bacterium]